MVVADVTSRTERLVTALGALRVAATTEGPALHQPITLLWAMGRAVKRRPRLVAWRDARQELRDLMSTYGRRISRASPEHPFVALNGTDLWELRDYPGEAPTGHGNPLGWLDQHNPRGGLAEWVYELIAQSVSARTAAIDVLTREFFEGTRPIALLQAVHLQSEHGDWHLLPGERILRRKLHERYGGSGEGGITPSARTPNILIFTDPDAGHRHGYFDEWAEDGTFHYTGEGQRGNQTFTRGNKAIRDHVQTGRRLRLFQGSRGTVCYVGEFVLDPSVPWSYGRAPETGGGPERWVIRFHMVRVGPPVLTSDVPVGVGYRPVDEAIEPAPAAPGQNRELNERNIQVHRHLQNQLAEALRAREIAPLSPSPADPNFDIAWRRNPEQLTVCEIKSLTEANEIGQLRMGLGQLLDYVDQLKHRAKTVDGVLWIEHPPTDERWVALCRRVGIRLAWPGLEESAIAGTD